MNSGNFSKKGRKYISERWTNTTHDMLVVFTQIKEIKVKWLNKRKHTTWKIMLNIIPVLENYKLELENQLLTRLWTLIMINLTKNQSY